MSVDPEEPKKPVEHRKKLPTIQQRDRWNRALDAMGASLEQRKQFWNLSWQGKLNLMQKWERHQRFENAPPDQQQRMRDEYEKKVDGRKAKLQRRAARAGVNGEEADSEGDGVGEADEGGASGDGGGALGAAIQREPARNDEDGDSVGSGSDRSGE